MSGCQRIDGRIPKYYDKNNMAATKNLEEKDIETTGLRTKGYVFKLNNDILPKFIG